MNDNNQENEQNKVKSCAASYEPLCHQLERNFRLRASDEKPKGQADNKPRRLTRPKSPIMQLAIR